MKTENIYCDYCHKMTTVEGVKKEHLNGFCVELGYSVRGWGRRRDFIEKQSVEICDDCFKKVKEKANELKDVIDGCKEELTTNTYLYGAI